MLENAPMITAIAEKRKELSQEGALLVGISGIDASGKGFVTAQLTDQLEERGWKVAAIGVDGWLNLPHVRFNPENPARHYYERAFRFEEMFESLVLPLKLNREIDLHMDYTEETATSYRDHRYQFQAIDVILLEGIFLLKRSLRHHFDLACWVECSFETALARAINRCQEGLSPLETIRAFTTIYFPAQRIHFCRDKPRAAADLIVSNDGPGSAVATRQDTVGGAFLNFASQAVNAGINDAHVVPTGRRRRRIC